MKSVFLFSYWTILVMFEVQGPETIISRNDPKCLCITHISIYYNIYLVILYTILIGIWVISCHECYPGTDPGGTHPARSPKIEKNMICWRKIVIFTRNTPQICLSAPPWLGILDPPVLLATVVCSHNVIQCDSYTHIILLRAGIKYILVHSEI